MGVRLTGDWQRLGQTLARWSRGLPPELPRALAEGITSRTIQRFDEQRAPDGSPWPPLSPSTLMQEVRPRDRLRGGGISRRAQERMAKRKALIRTGRLRSSISWKVRGTRIYVGTNVVYAAIHQFGGFAGRGRRVRIPARPFLGLSQTDVEEAEALLREWLSGR